jgi:hypothetical protein
MLALKLEGKVICQMSALVVSTKQPKAVGLPDSQWPEGKDALNTEVSSVNVISQKQISCFRYISSDLEKLHEIVILTINVSIDSDWRVHLKKIGRLPQDFGALLNDEESLLLGESSFTVKALLQEGQIGLRWVCGILELLVCKRMHCRSLSQSFIASRLSQP